jgi:hypothetical protein
MDSGCVVPTLRLGLSETVAAKLFTEASAICGKFTWATVLAGCRVVAGGTAAAESMLLRNARFFAEDNAGRSIAASTAMMAITTMSSISVKARVQVFIIHLWRPF